MYASVTASLHNRSVEEPFIRLTQRMPLKLIRNQTPCSKRNERTLGYAAQKKHFGLREVSSMQAHTLAVGRETSIPCLIQLVPIVENRQIVLQFAVTIRGH